MLSNLLLVSESLTLMAGKSSVPASIIWYRRWTPVVVSSLTPRIADAIRVQRDLSFAIDLLMQSRMTPHSSGSLSGLNAGTLPAFSNSAPLCTTSVASPPSSTISVGPLPSGHSSASLVHHQYSSSVSPFHANTGVPFGSFTVPPVSGRPTATAAAAWSCVEKMLQDTQRTSAPSSFSVSMRTAVWIVMCRLPMMRAPASGFLAPCCLRSAMRPGISCSASRISLRPNSASDRSLTLNGSRPAALAAANGFITSVTDDISCSSQPGPRGTLHAKKRRLALFRVLVSSWLHLFSSRRDEQPRPLRAGVGWKRHDPSVFEPCLGQQPLQLLVAEAEPDVPHLLPVILAIVRLHVDDYEPPMRLEDARHLGERALRLG